MLTWISQAVDLSALSPPRQAVLLPLHLPIHRGPELGERHIKHDGHDELQPDQRHDDRGGQHQHDQAEVDLPDV